MDIYIYILLGILAIFLPFIFIAKKRIDNNEPIAGWKRKQYLAEQRGEDTNNSSQDQSTPKGQTESKSLPKQERVKDLIGINEVKFGVFEKTRNEYSIILSTDSVNFDLLNPSEQQTIILGYQALFRVINFPIQILGQAVRQDLRKDEQRFKENLKNLNSQTQDYNYRVIENIKAKSEQDFRIAMRIYYVISYIYEPSKMAKLTKEQKERKIIEKLYQQAHITRKMLNRARIETDILDSVQAIEVLKRAMNRDRMLANPIDNLVEPGKEKITTYITGDPSSLPLFEELVQDPDEYNALIKDSLGQKAFEGVETTVKMEDLPESNVLSDILNNKKPEDIEEEKGVKSNEKTKEK
jgi:hypothetical protein